MALCGSGQCATRRWGSLELGGIFGKGYKIQVSDDAETWKEVYKTDEGRGGIDEITFPKLMPVMYVCLGRN